MSEIKNTESVFVDIAPAVVHLPETGLKKEDISEDGLIDPLETPLNEEGSVYCDLESKIEIEEDMIFKKESADLSEFIQETNGDSIVVMTGHVDDDESRRKEEEEEFSNRVTIEEFLPHLSGSEDYTYY